MKVSKLKDIASRLSKIAEGWEDTAYDLKISLKGKDLWFSFWDKKDAERAEQEVINAYNWTIEPFLKGSEEDFSTKVIETKHYGALREFDPSHILKEFFNFHKKLNPHKVAAEDREPVERTVKITLTLAEAAKALDHTDWLKENEYLDGDPHRDVWHDGYSSRSALRLDVKGMPDVEKIFPEAVAIAAEMAEREALAQAVGEARRDALVADLEAVEVTGEYMSGDGEMVRVSHPQIKSATVSDNKIEVTIVNPEHLINDIVNGVGYFAPPLDPYEKASDAEIKRYLIANIDDFFDVYGIRKPSNKLHDRFDPDISDDFLVEEVKFRCGELSIEEVAQCVIDAVEEDRLSKDEAITLAVKYSRESKAAILKDIQKILGNKMEKFK